jgi:hypothetical protein
MKKMLTLLLLISLCWLDSLSESAVNSKEQNFQQSLASAPLSATTSFAITDAGFLSSVSFHFSAVHASAETMKVYRKSRAGTNYNTLLASYTTTAASTVDVVFLVGNAIPIADTDQVFVTCTNAGAVDTLYVSVVLDTAPRGSGGIAIYDNGALKISGRDHDYHWHFGDVLPDANQVLGAFYLDVGQIAAPSNPGAGTRRLFVDSGTGKASVRTSAGTTVSLEETGHSIEDEATPLTQRSALNFTGTGVTCTDSGGKTVCDIPTGGAGTGDNITVNGAAATDADFDDTTPAAVGSGVNVKWQKDAGAPNNVSGYIQEASVSQSGIVTTVNQTFLGDKTVGDAGAWRWAEQTVNGTNAVSFRAPANLTASQSCVFQDTSSPIPDTCVGDGIDGPGTETDPTLTNDGAVTIGSGAVDPTVLTFNSDGGVDGTISWTGSSDLFSIAEVSSFAPSGAGSARLGQRLSTDTSANYGGAAFTVWSLDTFDESALFDVNRSKSNTIGTHALVASGDTLGTFAFRGSDGVAFQNGAAITAAVDGVTGVGDMPGRLVFRTSLDGTTSVTERMRIDNAGFVGIGQPTTPYVDRLQVKGAINADDQNILKVSELDANGTNFKGFQAPAAVTADTTCVLEDDANFIPDSCVGDGADAGSGVEVILDFGANGSELVSTVVTGQAWVAANSEIVCSPTMVATADRIEGAEDAVIEGLTVAAHTRVVGTGFTVTAGASQGVAIGKYAIHCVGV